MRNKVQVFGLPRSGTNFVEWSLVKYFDTGYSNLYKKCDVKGLVEYGKKCALKHSYPSLEYSDYCIVIFKEPVNEWYNSYKKRGKIKNFKGIYNRYRSKAELLPEDKCIILNHKNSYKNYENTINLISSKI